jgi:mycothiol system anti-sigma-R factor
MSSKEAQELISALVDDELTDQERVSLEGHLKGCPKCRFIYEKERVLKRRVRSAAANMSAPADLRQKIRRSLRQFCRLRGSTLRGKQEIA